MNYELVFGQTKPEVLDTTLPPNSARSSSKARCQIHVEVPDPLDTSLQAHCHLHALSDLPCKERIEPLLHLREPTTD